VTIAAANSGGVKSADRVMAVLDLVAEAGSLSFGEIAGRLELPKSSPHPMKLTSRAGVRLPAHTSAIGKALLASLDTGEARRRLDGAVLTRLTANTIGDVPTLLDELERVRRQGYSLDNEEFAIGLRCVAMPVLDAQDKTVAAMSVSMPTPRYNRSVMAHARKALAETVAQATERLGRWRD
jgi:DNA-binding IclR family transcriptional regulator